MASTSSSSSSSSSLRLSLLLCFVCAFFTSPSTSNPLADLCAKSKNPKFCLSVLYDYQSLNLHVLTETTIKFAEANATATVSKISLLLNQTSDPKLEVIYNLCKTNYNGAVRNLVDAEQYLSIGQYQNLSTAAVIVGQNAFNCETAFNVTPGYFSNITKENDDLQNFSGILVASAELFLGSS
ncbi:hypothetical protein RND71_026804 [Anisodus tanguticus]|uniref:Pectinesterase inhibitor domain-containing protein n=1 Tax=Anisodus tanguticus TaxID=243964 RepID=A0AAE1VBM3_9SOLA|nr:hypothetical protein RND71_026804 [Anisodus tanguticus]